MAKRIILTFLALVIIGGGIAGIKVLQIRRLVAQGANVIQPPETINSAQVQMDSWESVITAVATLEAAQGLTISAEQPGKVVEIAFTPGTTVSKGDLLARLDSSAEEAQLRSIQTSRHLAQTNLRRLAELIKKGLIAQIDYDNAEATFNQASAQIDNIKAIINKKTIRAPFSGRLGVRLINLGQILKEGEAIVSLQVLDPIFVNFMLPQQSLNRIKIGMPIRLNGDSTNGQPLLGEITTINPMVDKVSRNVQVQATVANPDEVLRPGMFSTVSVVLPKRNDVLTIPGTAVLYAPYSDSVFVVEEKKDEKTGKNEHVLRQQFVRLGEKRGDFVAVLTGVKKDETIASTGVFKLRNGQAVVIDNTHAPTFELNPKPENN
ncbi:MAG: efflux RND transporter periplasmic adaptor subunit [Desulfobulbaceae bacterium]|nr:efflux RND transporter periplasmic adaptor subunit [Desulfobulbaceae bacterium]